MKVSRIKELLAEYPDDTELMIAWNDKENFMIENNEIWHEAILIYEDTSLEGFIEDCRWAVNQAEREAN